MWQTLIPWILFNLFIIIMLVLDLVVFHCKAHQVSIKEAAGLSIFWILLALLFNLGIYFIEGAEASLSFFTGYLIEKSLSIDNLFIFLLIFKYFHTPPKSQHKVLFWGILGAIVMRALFIWLGIALISQFHWMFYVFGALLIISGIKLGLEKDKEIHPENNPIIKLFTCFFPVTKEYENDHFFVVRNGCYMATPLFIALLTIETTDIVFAIDSIPAILAITFDPFIVYTSNIFAILGMRSLYFILSHLMSLFHYLHYGLSAILVFIGIKMLFADFMPIHTVVALGFIFITLTLSIIASVLFPKNL